MKTCPSCQAGSEPSARFCLECGHAFADMPQSTPEDPWLGRMVSGRFRIIAKLGDGGMGEVFQAEQLPMGRMVALKVLRHTLSDDPHQVERFKREAQAASQLKHPNTIIVHDFGQDDDGTLFLAMELLEGQALSDALDEGPMDPVRAARIMAQVCLSLDEAHNQGMVHRDLKPENIFLTERGGATDFVKVLDFGIAKVRQASDGGKLDTITRDGAIFGTPQYMSPEQIRGEQLDPRADVYAMGVVLYQAISGQLPFAASTVVEMLTKHLSAVPSRIEGIEVSETVAQLEAIALRALAKDRADRQPSARAFLSDLSRAVPAATLHSMTGVVPLTDPPPTAPMRAAVPRVERPAPAPAPLADELADEPPRRSRAGLWLLLLLLLGGGGAAWFFLMGPGADRAPDAGTKVAAVDGGTKVAALSPRAEAGVARTDAAAPTRSDAAPAAADGARPRDGGRPVDAAPARDAGADPDAASAPDAAQAPAPDAARAPAPDADLRVLEVAAAKAAREAAEKARQAAAAETARKAAAVKAAAAAKAEADRLRAEIEAARAKAAAAKKPVVATPTKPRSKFGTITVKAGKSSRVYLNGRPQGTGPVKLRKLKPGRYLVEIRKGKARERKHVTVRAGRTSRANFEL